MSFIAQPDNFIENVKNDLIFYNTDENVTLDGYKRMSFSYTPDGGQPQPFPPIPVRPLFYVAQDGTRHVRAVIVPWTPVITQFRFFQKLFVVIKSLFFKRAAAGSSTGTLTGTMDKDDSHSTEVDPPSFTMIVTFYDP